MISDLQSEMEKEQKKTEKEERIANLEVMIREAMEQDLHVVKEEREKFELELQNKSKEASESAKAILDAADKNSQRQQVIQEIIETERDYVRDLLKLKNIFLEPIVKEAIPGLKFKEIETIFTNITMLCNINGELLEHLEEETSVSIVNAPVGRIFNQMSSLLKLYTQYVAHFDSTLDLVKHEREKNHVLDKFITEAEAKPECHGLLLNSFLIKPVQRVCKYPLLIREMLRCTDSSHPDHPDLLLASQSVSNLANYLNEKNRDTENLLKVAEIQKNLVGYNNLCEPSRRFIAEGTFVKHSNGKVQERVFFLFNDILLWAARPTLVKKAPLQFKGLVPLNRCLVSDLPETETNKNAFQICRLDERKKKYILVAPNKAEKRSFINQMTAIVNHHLEQAAKPTGKIIEKILADAREREMHTLNKVPSSGSMAPRAPKNERVHADNIFPAKPSSAPSSPRQTPHHAAGSASPVAPASPAVPVLSIENHMKLLKTDLDKHKQEYEDAVLEIIALKQQISKMMSIITNNPEPTPPVSQSAQSLQHKYETEVEKRKQLQTFKENAKNQLNDLNNRLI